MREPFLSLNVNGKSSLRAFDLSLKNLKLEYNNFKHSSVKTTIQVAFEIGVFFDQLEKKMNFSSITLPSMREEES